MIREKSKRLQWPARPRVSRSVLGWRRRWMSQCGSFLIDRFGDGSGDYICAWRDLYTGRMTILGRRRKLDAAKALCETQARRWEAAHRQPLAVTRVCHREQA